MYNDGKRGEKLFQQIMESRGYEVIDERDNPECWIKDIDFTVTSPTSGLTKTFEIKWDARLHRTGNLYLELENIFSKQWNGGGWWPHCQADFLAYGDQQTKTFYIISLLDLRERVEELPTRIAHCGQESTGLLVRLEDIKDIVQVL